MKDMTLWFRYIALGCCCLFGLNAVKSQGRTHHQVEELWKEANTRKKTKDFKQALSIMDKAINLQNNDNETLPYHLGFSHLLKGRIYLLTDVCTLGEPDLQKAIDIFTQLDSADALFRATVRMAELYKTVADYENSIFYYEQALAVSQKYWGEVNSKAGVTYGNIGFNYYYLEDYEATKIYMEKYRTMLEQALPADNLSLAKCYNNYGSISWRINEFEKAQEYYLKCLAIYQQKLEPDDSHFLELFNNLGGIYLNQQDTVQALKYYQQAMDTETLIKGEEIDFLTNIKGSVELTMQSYQKTLARRKQTFGTQHPSTLGCYLYIGGNFSAQGLHKKALESYQLMINGLLPEFDNDSVESNPQNFTSAQEEPLLLSALTQKAEIFYSQYKEKGDSNKLNLAFATYLSATKLIDQIKKGYKTEASYIYWTENLRPTYDRAIEIGFKLYEKTGDSYFQNAAFNLAEKSRSFSLLLGIRGQKAITFSGISEKLLKKERSLREQLNSFHQAILNERKKGRKANREKVELFGDKKLELERSYSRFIKQIEKDYPSYFDLKYNSISATPSEIQQFLAQQKSSAFIEYVWSGEQLYAFLITPKQQKFISLGNSYQLESQVNQLRKSIGDWQYITEHPAEAYQDYTQNSLNLYQFLFEPIEKYLAQDSATSRLIISPDGILGYLPFDLLLTDSLSSVKRAYATLPYLLKTYAISYANSATLFTQSSERTKSNTYLPSTTFLGFAPTYEGKLSEDFVSRNDFAKLTHNREEVENAAKIWNGKSITGKEANEKSFYSLSGKATILHLAMHAFVNDTNPQFSGLVFGTPKEENPSAKDNYLYAYELYNLNLHAQLTVLSACNTGLGKSIKGEGIMNLARGFRYAGCKSIVFSLWQIDDESTATLMANFYQNLKNGETKDRALQNAKLHFLDHADPIISHPYYWGAFTLVGENNVLEYSENQNRRFYLLLIFLAVLLVGGGFAYKFSRRREMASL